MTERLHYTEKEQLQLIADGDEAAFRQLFNDYRKKLYSYLLRITESKEMAEDAVQEIFLKLWDKRATLPGIDNINAYIHRMAHNHAFHGFRRLARETLVLEQLKKESNPIANPGQLLVSKEVGLYIQSLVDRLTPQQRNVFLLSREEGLKQQEIADRLGISVFTVKKHMVDALHFLRDELSQQYGSQAIALFVIYQLGPY